MNRYRLIEPNSLFATWLKHYPQETWDKLFMSVWGQAIASDQVISHEYSAIVEAAALSSAERFKFLSLHQWMSILWMSCARATSDAPLLDEIDPEEVIADLKKYMEILT